MINDIELILSKQIDEVLEDSITSLLVKSCYSILYANGMIVKGCQDSLRKYYRQFQIDGIMKAQQYEQVKNRICKPSWVGLKYVTKVHSHINPDLLSDESAATYLVSGILQESDFTILPPQYLELKNKKSEPEENSIIETEKEFSKPKGKKKK